MAQGNALEIFFQNVENGNFQASSDFILLAGVLALISIVFISYCRLFFRVARLKNTRNELLANNKYLLEKHCKQHQQVTHIASRLIDVIQNTEKEIASWESHDDWLRYCGNVNAQTNSLRALSFRLLDFNFDRVSHIRELSQVDTHHVIDSGLSIFVKLCHLSKQKCVIDNASTAIIDLPEGLLEKLFQCLLSNAMKHSKNSGCINIRTSSDHNGFYLVIEDEGSGIPSERLRALNKLRHINTFIDKTDQIIDRTQGLTLEDIASLCTRYGGDFEVVSALGMLTRMRLQFPVNAKVRSKTLSESHMYCRLQNLPVINTHASKPPLLMLSLNHTSAHTLEAELVKSFYCESCTSIDAALDLCSWFMPELVLIEHDSPNNNGMDALQVLNVLFHHKGSSPSCVILTPKNDQKSKLNMLRNGASAVINAPYSIKEIHLVLLNLQNERPVNTPQIIEASAAYTAEKPESYLKNKAKQFLVSFDESIEGNYADPSFNIEKAASGLFVDKRTLARRLSNATAMTFTEHLRKRRLGEAKRLIIAGEQISNVCFSVGFNNLSHFSTAFKKEFGVAPSKIIDISHGHL